MLPVQTLTFNLQTRTADFGKALRKLGRALPKRGCEQAILSYDGQMLHIELGGGTITVAAEGKHVSTLSYRPRHCNRHASAYSAAMSKPMSTVGSMILNPTYSMHSRCRPVKSPGSDRS